MCNSIRKALLAAALLAVLAALLAAAPAHEGGGQAAPDAEPGCMAAWQPLSAPDADGSGVEPEPFAVDGLKYQPAGDGTVSCVGVEGDPLQFTTIAVPGQVEHDGQTYLCKSIACQAFLGCKKLESVAIGEGVESVGDDAFGWCYELKRVSIPGSVKTIGAVMFDDCYSLESIEVDPGNACYSSVDGVLLTKDGKTLINYPASRCAGGTYTVPDGVETIQEQAFYRCYLKGVMIGGGVKEIGVQAFFGCDSLTDVTIGEGVETIREIAFLGCGSMASISIPKSVSSIGPAAFSACESLAAVTVEEGNAWYSSTDGVLFSNGGKTLVCYPAGRQCAAYGIPDGVEAVSDGAFQNCRSLESVDIPDSVRDIGGFAFSGCSFLVSMAIPDGVTAIKEGIFGYCTALESVYIPEGVTVIKDSAFEYCKALESIEIPDGVTAIGRSAFSNCSALVSVEIPDGVTEIGGYAFDSCESLVSVEILNGVTEIKEGTFWECEALVSVEIPASVETIGNSAFYKCRALESIAIPDSVKTIEDDAFEYCSALESAVIGEGIETIGSDAFYGCGKLADVTFKGASPPELGARCLGPGSACTVHSSFYSNVNQIPDASGGRAIVYDGPNEAPPEPADLADAKVRIVGRCTYTGEEQDASFAVSTGSIDVTGEVEVFSGGSGIDADTYELVVKAKEGSHFCKGQAAPAVWTIAPKALEDAMISLGEAPVYDGQEHKVGFTVKDGGRPLTSETDYAVVDGTDAATDAGTHVLEISGMGNYAGTASAEWTISPDGAVSLADATVEIVGEYTYTGKQQSVRFAVKVGDATIPDGELAIASGGAGIDAGPYKLVVKAKEGSCFCKGEAAPVEWTIAPKALGREMISFSGGAIVFNGETQAVGFVVRDGARLLTPGTDYTVVEGTDAATDAGTYTLEIRGEGNYTGTASKEWRIAPKALENAMIKVGDEPIVFNRTAQNAAFTVADGEAVLVRGDDYVVVGGTDTATGAGTYILKVEGRGNYAGEATAEWKIAPKQLNGGMVVRERTVFDEGVPPKYEVRDGAAALSEGADYSVVVWDVSAAGLYVLEIEGMGNYAGGASASWPPAPGGDADEPDEGPAPAGPAGFWSGDDIMAAVAAVIVVVAAVVAAAEFRRRRDRGPGRPPAGARPGPHRAEGRLTRMCQAPGRTEASRPRLRTCAGPRAPLVGGAAPRPGMTQRLSRHPQIEHR